MFAHALLALALVISAEAHECRLPFLNPRLGGAVYGHDYFDRRVTPLPEGDARGLGTAAPDCADRTHLLDAAGECLTNEQVRALTAETRRARLEKALSDLDGYQEAYRSRRISGERPAWSRADAEAVRNILRINGDVLPEDVSNRYEGWLRADGWALSGRVRLPDGDPFGKRGYFADGLETAFAQTPSAFSARQPRADYRQYDAVIDAAVWSDPKAGLSSGYDSTVRRVLKLIVRYADPQDARDVLDIITRLGPRIHADAEGMPPAQGGAMSPLKDPKTGKTYFKVRYNPAYVVAGGVALRSGSGTYRELLGADPDLSPYQGATPERTERRGGMTAEVYRDAVVLRYSDVELAETILHELMHIRTRERNQGAVVPINEEASRQAEMRLVDNYARATGALPQSFLSQQGAKAYLSWKYDRVGYRSRLRRLMADPLAYHVEATESTPEGLAAKVRADLALKGRAFTAAKLAEVAKFVDAEAVMLQDELGRLREVGAIDERTLRLGLANLKRDRDKAVSKGPTDAEWHELLQDKLARIPQDKKLLQQLSIDDLLWRQRYQFSLPVP